MISDLPVGCCTVSGETSCISSGSKQIWNRAEVVLHGVDLDVRIRWLVVGGQRFNRGSLPCMVFVMGSDEGEKKMGFVVALGFCVSEERWTDREGD